MKKHAITFAILVSGLSLASMSWADNIGQDGESDAVHGHGAVPASEGQAYVAAESRSGEVGTDVISYPQDFKAGSPAQPGTGSDHDDHEDTLHAVVKHK